MQKFVLPNTRIGNEYILNNNAELLNALIDPPFMPISSVRMQTCIFWEKVWVLLFSFFSVISRFSLIKKILYREFYKTVEPFFPVGHSSNGKSITLDEVLLTSLLYLGSNIRYYDVMVSFISKQK